jgi:hypothetical protein
MSQSQGCRTNHSTNTCFQYKYKYKVVTAIYVFRDIAYNTELLQNNYVKEPSHNYLYLEFLIETDSSSVGVRYEIPF